MQRRHLSIRTQLLLFLMAASLLALLFLLLSHPLPLSSSSHHRYRRRSLSPISVYQVCRATRFPSTCRSTLSTLLPSHSTPTQLLLAALFAPTPNLTASQANAHSIVASSVSNLNRTNAAKNCVELLHYSSYRLSQASTAVSESNIHDAVAWTSAALLYQYDCWSALKYVNGTKQVDDAMWLLLSLQEITSNALSLLFSFRRFGNDTSKWTTPPQTERDGYWDDSASANVVVTSSASLRSFLPTASDLRANPNARVCKDGGGGCHSSVQGAVDAAPDHGDGRFVIYIKEGVYKENVKVPLAKKNLVFVGDGMGKTVITGSLNAQMVGVSTYNTATVSVNGDGFVAKDLTFENTAGPNAHQAVAFRSDSDLSVIENVELLGHQDTLYAHSLRQFYKSCRIVGTVDFVFGNSATVFQDCVLLIQPRQASPRKGETNSVTAQGRTDPGQATGFVFENCIVNGTEEYMVLYRQNPSKHRNYLGRPWKEYSRTVYIRCYLQELVRPEGWLPWRGDFALSTLFYGEFESSGPGANPGGRVRWSNQIPAEHVGAFSAQSFIQGGAWIPDRRF